MLSSFDATNTFQTVSKVQYCFCGFGQNGWIVLSRIKICNVVDCTLIKFWKSKRGSFSEITAAVILLLHAAGGLISGSFTARLLQPLSAPLRNKSRGVGDCASPSQSQRSVEELWKPQKAHSSAQHTLQTSVTHIDAQEHTHTRRRTQCQNPSVLSTHAHRPPESKAHSRRLWTWTESPTRSTEANSSAPANCCVSHSAFLLSVKEKPLWQVWEPHRCVCANEFRHMGKHWVCVYDSNNWDVHSLFINTYRVRMLDESRPWQVPRLTRSWFLGDVECRADTESSQSALKSQDQNSHHNYQWWIIDWVRNIQGVLQRMWALHPLWLFDSSSPPVALSLSCRLPRDLNAQTGN